MNVLASLPLAPHPSFWWISPLFPIAIALIIYLYRAQRKLISSRIATGLTLCRIGLIILLFILFLQPALQWTHSRTSSGELWLLVDQSPSMQSTDPQSSPAERLHWAEALGYLSRTARPAKPDLLLAAFTATTSELSTIRPTSSTLSTPVTAQQDLDRVSAFSSPLTTWSKNLDTLRAALAADPSNPTDALDALDRAISTLKSGQSAAKNLTTLRDADAAINWSTIQTDFTLAANSLATLAATSDAAFLAAHADDSDVSTAAARIANISRSDLANLFLTGIDKRSPLLHQNHRRPHRQLPRPLRHLRRLRPNHRRHRPLQFPRRPPLRPLHPLQRPLHQPRRRTPSHLRTNRPQSIRRHRHRQRLPPLPPRRPHRTRQSGRRPWRHILRPPRRLPRSLPRRRRRPD